MASIFADIQGVKWERESVNEPGECVVEITFCMPIYTASSDNGQMGGTGTKRNGVSIPTAQTLEQFLAADRRDGKTVTLSAVATTVALCAEAGKQGSTKYYFQTPAVSSNNLTFNISNAAGTEIDAAAGVFDRPITMLLYVTLT